MANIVITTTTDQIRVDFGAYYPSVIKYSKGTWKKTSIDNIELFAYWIEVIGRNSETWRVSHDGTDNSLIIDSIDGAAPSSLADLYTKLQAII